MNTHGGAASVRVGKGGMSVRSGGEGGQPYALVGKM